MVFFTKLTEGLSNIFQKKNKNRFSFINFDEAKSVVVLVGTQTKDLNQIQKFLNSEFKNKKVQYIEFAPENKQMVKNSCVVNASDYSYWGSVKKTSDFFELKDISYDLLIDLVNEENKLTKSVISMLSAKTKICKFKNENQNYNLMIKIDDKLSNIDFLEQVLFYLRNINKNK